MKHKISIVIPCYNDGEFVKQSIESALSQSYPHTEVIVVDDGSDRETKNLLKELEPKLTNLIFQSNKGVSAARNRGIEVATGDFILVLDSDDYFESDFCEKALKIFQENSDAKLVTCHARWFKNKRDFQIHIPEGGTLPDFLTASVALSNSLFRKSDWKDIGGYDEKMLTGWEDWEFFIRLHKGGGKTYVIPEVLFHYRWRPRSRTTLANANKYELLEYIYLKHSDVYKENYEKGVKALFHRLKVQEREKIRCESRLDNRIGKLVLMPFRKIKKIFTAQDFS